MDANQVFAEIRDALIACPELDAGACSAIVPAYRAIIDREVSWRGQPTAFQFARQPHGYQLTLACGDGTPRRFDVAWRTKATAGAVLAGYGKAEMT